MNCPVGFPYLPAVDTEPSKLPVPDLVPGLSNGFEPQASAIVIMLKAEPTTIPKPTFLAIVAAGLVALAILVAGINGLWG